MHDYFPIPFYTESVIESKISRGFGKLVSAILHLQLKFDKVDFTDSAKYPHLPKLSVSHKHMHIDTKNMTRMDSKFFCCLCCDLCTSTDLSKSYHELFCMALLHRL